jgi:hypothetical protein
MADTSAPPRCNRFYTSVPLGPPEGLAPSASSAFIRMRRAESWIKAVVRDASDSKVVAFPIRQVFSRHSKQSNMK